MLGMNTEGAQRWSDSVVRAGAALRTHLDQQVEVDAREREDELAEEFTVEDLRQAQRDAGVPVSQG